MTVSTISAAPVGVLREERMVIVASSLGTVFEWYDFFLYGTLAAFFGSLFFPAGNDTASLLASLATFGAGFGVRPFGAIVFGRLGDMIGRKYTFLVTILIMGASTALVGLLPTYATIGIWAPILLVTLRLAQGLALGGEYGGAATYVAEHAAPGKRGFDTSWIQTTATFGLFVSLAVILLCRQSMSADDFKNWGWRIPFLISIVLLGVSVYIRLQLHESPVFQKMKNENRTSRHPLQETFGDWRNLKVVLLALFGATMGQGVVWYAGQFQALSFITSTLHASYETGYILIGCSLVIGTPFFVVFGRLSDRIGRKWIIMAGLLLPALTYFPLFHALTHYVNPALERASLSSPVTVSADNCNFNIFAKPSTPCDFAKSYLTAQGISYTSAPGTPGQAVVTKIGGTELRDFDAKTYQASYGAALKTAGYPAAADPAQINWVMAVLVLVVLMLYVTMVYGPMAAFLAEMFPARIRYTSMSFPYHIGNGWFGGFLPFIMLSISIYAGDIYAGLWYPIVCAVGSLVIGSLLLKENLNRPIAD